jgi:hypothetical protein
MRLKARDVLGTVLVVAIAVPYVWFLIDGSAPFAEDPRGMSAIGLVLALAAYMVIQRGDPDDTTDRVEIALYVVSLGLGDRESTELYLPFTLCMSTFTYCILAV